MVRRVSKEHGLTEDGKTLAPFRGSLFQNHVVPSNADTPSSGRFIRLVGSRGYGNENDSILTVQNRNFDAKSQQKQFFSDFPLRSARYVNTNTRTTVRVLKIA